MPLGLQRSWADLRLVAWGETLDARPNTDHLIKLKPKRGDRADLFRENDEMGVSFVRPLLPLAADLWSCCAAV
jgi:hypothetical protein